LAQFLSAKANIRTDSYGGDATSRARIIIEIIAAIGEVVSSSFCIGVKLNSVDVESASGMSDCIEQLRAITAANIDFLEISGGSFEDPTFNTGLGTSKIELQQKKASTIAREAFFMDFARAIRTEFPQLPLIVTGGFRSRRAMEAALSEGSCDMIGLARPSVIDPLLPRNLLLNPKVPEYKAVARVKSFAPSAAAKYTGVKLLGVGPERVSPNQLDEVSKNSY
jgi:2,4-dienoyl-CoA reductase-like NADH-dependent reductase (Old Yellow Enzyme family)